MNEVDKKATNSKLKRICRHCATLKEKVTANNATDNEIETVNALEECYMLLDDENRFILSNWLARKEIAPTDVALYIELGLSSTEFYRRKERAVLKLADMLGVIVYRE